MNLREWLRLASLWTMNVGTGLENSLRDSTLEQKEAYGRLAHTLTAASIIGVVSLWFARENLLSDVAWRVFGLIVSAMVFFVMGAFLSKGE